MHCCHQDNKSDEEINAVIDKILAEDQCEKLHGKRRFMNRNTCKQIEDLNNDKKKSLWEKCKIQYTGITKSKRFSLYVMEALRGLQRQKKHKVTDKSKFFTTCEIINYINSNFLNDGDLEAQVRIALKRTCWQGFVKNEGRNKYRLIGPFAGNFSNIKKINFIHSTYNPLNNECCCSTHSSNYTQERFETNWSVNSSTEGNKLHKKNKSNINNLHQRRLSNNNYNAVMNLNLSGHVQDSEIYKKRKNFSNQSSAREENEIVGCIYNPIREIIDKQVPECIEVDRNENKVDKCINLIQNIDYNLDKNVLPEFRNEDKNLPKQIRERELKRWIENCKRERARQANHKLH